jgi:hypothetical protein
MPRALTRSRVLRAARGPGESVVALAPRGWLLGRCLSLAPYVTVTGPTDGAAAAGGG